MLKMKPITIDLLWVRPGKVGGTEVFTRNLLDGFYDNQKDIQIFLLLSKDNAYSFQKYRRDNRFHFLVAPVNSENIIQRVLWQFLFESIYLRKKGLKNCFVPVLYRPLINAGIRYINVIHDIQAFYYPQYHPVYEVWCSRLCWYLAKWLDVKTVVTSEWVKKDLIRTFHFKEKQIKVIPIPVKINQNDNEKIERIEEKYGIHRGEYYYTVAQIIPHKNLETLIEVFNGIKTKAVSLPSKLIISGPSGNALQTVIQKIREYHLEQEVLLTGYISDGERNTLYQYARAFLFPSVFEGFGIPPIEAMMLKTTVITTRCTSIPEVTQECANYVENPYDVQEWICAMKEAKENRKLDQERFSIAEITGNYLQLFDEVF